MKRIKKIMLIDDSEADNFVHSRVIRKADVADEIVVKYNGEEALEYLITALNGKFPKPEIIFLDINMPGMNGWEFLEAYEKIEDNQKADIVVCMLTTSESDEDKKKAKEYTAISGFNHKPLTHEMLMKVIDVHTELVKTIN